MLACLFNNKNRHLGIETSNIAWLSLKPAGNGRHAHEGVRGDDRDVLVQPHHERLQLLRHLPRVPAQAYSSCGRLGLDRGGQE